ncbi:exosome complex component RRP43 [Babesia caballi]|uniref:Ribosomal RNA-processing protein 43 n=1 Tax=Babesia caballi TaxID=5871 RepID=A0AAV4LPD0_BABCB|nr:exosome complex component RRP43 [Babesia caballi]
MSAHRGEASHAPAFSTDVYRQIDPAGFYSQFLSRKVRPDGRKLQTFRTVGVSDLLEGPRNHSRPLDAEGLLVASVRITVGETHVHCVTKAIPTFAEVIAPPSPGSDNLVAVEVELPKQVQSYIHDANGHTANFQYCVSSLLETVLNCDEVIPTAQLRFAELLRAGASADTEDRLCAYMLRRRFCWKVEISVHCEEYDGNLLDASVMAAAFTLRKTFLPVVLLDASESSGLYELRALDRRILESAQKQDPQATKLLSDNRRLIEQQLGLELSDADMPRQLLGFLGPSEIAGRPLRMLAQPFTVTFLRFDEETFLVDPTREEERIGVSVSVYCLLGSDGSSRTQPLYLTSCPGVPAEVYDCLEQQGVCTVFGPLGEAPNYGVHNRRQHQAGIPLEQGGGHDPRPAREARDPLGLIRQLVEPALQRLGVPHVEELRPAVVDLGRRLGRQLRGLPAAEQRVAARVVVVVRDARDVDDSGPVPDERAREQLGEVEVAEEVGGEHAFLFVGVNGRAPRDPRVVDEEVYRGVRPEDFVRGSLDRLGVVEVHLHVLYHVAARDVTPHNARLQSHSCVFAEVLYGVRAPRLVPTGDDHLALPEQELERRLPPDPARPS